MPARHRANDDRRELEKRPIERARHHVRLFDQRGVLVDQGGLWIVDSPRRLRRGCHPFHHRLRALAPVREDMVVAELVEVGAGALDDEAVRGEEPVSARLRRASHACEAHVDEVLAVEGDEPLHGAPEGDVADPPSHGLAKRDRAADVGEDFAEELARGLPFFDAPADDVAPRLLLARAELGGLGLVDDDELGDRHAELGREGFGGLRGLAVFEGRGLGGTDDFFVEVELGVGEARRR